MENFFDWACSGGFFFFNVNVNVSKKLTSTFALQGVHCAIASREPTYDLYALVDVGVSVGVNLPITLLMLIVYMYYSCSQHGTMEPR